MNASDIFQIGKTPVEIRQEPDGSHAIYHEGKKIDSPSMLLQKVPDLQLPAHALQAAQIINFWAHGLSFQVIDNPKEFKDKYLKQLVEEKSIQDNQHFRTSSYGSYDPQKITYPEWKEGRIVFYTVNQATGVPYRVTFKPAEGYWEPECRYELLPMISP